MVFIVDLFYDIRIYLIFEHVSSFTIGSSRYEKDIILITRFRTAPVCLCKQKYKQINTNLYNINHNNYLFIY